VVGVARQASHLRAEAEWVVRACVGGFQMKAVMNCEHARITQASYDVLRVQLAVSDPRRIIAPSDRARRPGAIVSGGRLVWCSFAALILFFHLPAFANAQDTGNFQTQVDSGGLVVTNETGDAVLDVPNGSFIQNGGVVQADILVVTNASARYIRNGGTLRYNHLVLDPKLSAVGDGIPNGWKQRYNLDPFDPTVASADPLGKGVSNLQQYLAGTDPTNSASVLRVVSLNLQGDSLQVCWQAGGGRTNVLQAARSPWGVYFNISPSILTPDDGDIVTNYLVRGCATNTSCSMYPVVYRVAVGTFPPGGATAPTLTITSPTDESYATNSALTVTGTSASAYGVAGVDVQGIAASSSNGSSNWVAVITISTPCTNMVTVLAGDNAAPADITTNSLHVIYATGTADCNGDGLPDLWQIQYFGSVSAANAAPTADPAEDGLNNLENYLLGVDPTNADSFGDGISDGPLSPPGSGLQPGPDPNLVVANGSVCYPYTGLAQVACGMLNMGRGPALCPLLKVGLNPSMSPSTVFDTTSGPATYTLAENYNQPTNDIYLQYADVGTNAVGSVIHKTVPFFLEPGSARYAATVAVDTNLAISALDTNDTGANWWATNVAIYSSLNYATTNYVRNANCWAGGFDLTCIAVCNSFEMNSQMGGTLVSPRHVVFAHHFTIPNGTTLQFVARNNTVVSRVLSNSVQIGSSDLQIGVLDSDVPTNLITFAEVLPSSCTNYFPNSLQPISTNYIPALCLNQYEDALESDISAVAAGGVSCKPPSNPTRGLFYENKVSGDSGQPVFIILNGHLVLLTVYTYVGAGSGWFIPGYIDQINSAMAALGGGYSLAQVNLSPFAYCNGGSGSSP